MAKFSDALRRFLRRDDFTLKSSGAEIASTTGSAVELGDAGTLSFVVDVTAVGGTPTLIVDIEGSIDGTTWFLLARVGSDGYRVGSVGAAPANITGVVTVRGACPASRHVRYRSTIGGGIPSLTYSVTADAA